MRPVPARGFTLLEAIVALVIFSMGAFALYGWLSTNLHALARADASRERLALGRAALEVVRRVNPMEAPTGQRELGDVQVRWRAEAVEPPRRGRAQVGGNSLFEVGLYELDVYVLEHGREVQRFAVRQPGYRQVANLEWE